MTPTCCNGCRALASRFRIWKTQRRRTTSCSTARCSASPPNGTWHERQEQPRGREVLYEYKQINVVAGKIDYRRLDDTVDLFVDFPQRKICWRETATPNGGEYRCPYAVVSFE